LTANLAAVGAPINGAKRVRQIEIDLSISEIKSPVSGLSQRNVERRAVCRLAAGADPVFIADDLSRMGRRQYRRDRHRRIKPAAVSYVNAFPGRTFEAWSRRSTQFAECAECGDLHHHISTEIRGVVLRHDRQSGSRPNRDDVVRIPNAALRATGVAHDQPIGGWCPGGGAAPGGSNARNSSRRSRPGPKPRGSVAESKPLSRKCADFLPGRRRRRRARRDRTAARRDWSSALPGILTPQKSVFDEIVKQGVAIGQRARNPAGSLSSAAMAS
jgi:hypothetical protein